MPSNVLQDSPAESQFAKVNDLPPPTLSRAREVDAGGVELRGAQGRRLRCPSAQGDQQVPGGAEVPGELEAHRVGGGALGCAAHVDLSDQKSLKVKVKPSPNLYTACQAVKQRVPVF